MPMHFLLLIVSIIPLSILSQPEINFKKKVHKFSKTKEGLVLEHDFLFSNSGNKPLLIQDIKVSCSCTKFNYQEKEILPGESSEIHILFNTENKYGWQDRKLIVFSNAKNNPETIRFKVMVDNK